MSRTDSTRPLLVLASSGWGGTERAFTDLAEGLARHGPVVAALPRDAEARLRLDLPQVQILDLPPGSRRNPGTLLALRRLIRTIEPDLVHAHAARAAEMAFWATRGLSVPLLATKHNTRGRAIFRWVPHVTAVSQAAADSIAGRRDVRVIPNGVGTRLRTEAPDAAPAHLRLVGVGRLHVHKGFDRLLAALPALEGDWTLELGGEGPAHEALQRQAEALGLSDQVHFLGHREDAEALMSGADLVIVPSRTEGFGLVTVEALRAAPVLLASDVGVAPEVLPPSLLLPAGARCEAALRTAFTSLRNQYASLARETAEARSRVASRFSLAEMVDGYRSAYRSVLEDDSA